jgi:hypothetical protein
VPFLKRGDYRIIQKKVKKKDGKMFSYIYIRKVMIGQRNNKKIQKCAERLSKKRQKELQTNKN